MKLGQAAGRVLRRRIQGHRHVRVVIGKDTRVSGYMLEAALQAGFSSAGVDVVLCGPIPTPAIAYLTRGQRADAGVVISASHNPYHDNGIKFFSESGMKLPDEVELEIEKELDAGFECVESNELGKAWRLEDAAGRYIEFCKSTIDSHVNLKGLRILVDCANGASAITTPALIGRLGVRAITVNADQQGTFPGHPSEPTEDNLAILKKLVMDTGADLGIAHDGDADRCVFITGSGRYVSGDQALAVLARYLLRKNKGKDVMVTVATSSVVEDVVSSNGGKVEYTAVGSPIVARAMRSGGGIFGGEENGGLIFADHQYCRDGAMGAAVMLECISNIGCLDSQIDSLPRYHTVKTAISCPDELKQALIERLHSMHSDERCNLLDGLRIDYDDGWVLVRPSGTEPKFRIYSESRVQEVAERRSMEFKQEAEGVLEKLKQSAETASPSSA